VREIVYPLWDMGLDVGHATRSIKECVSMARKDYEVLTSILDARFICGMSPLFMKLMDQIRAKFINLKPDAIIAWLVETNRERHRRFGDSSYLLEPNFKEGQGGLRDYHTMLWIAKIKSGIKERRDLEYYGYFSHDDYDPPLRRAVIHLEREKPVSPDDESKRRSDSSGAAAQTGGGHGDTGSERPSARGTPVGELHGHMEYVKQQHEMFLYEMEQKKRLKRKNKRLKTTLVKGLKFNRGMLNFTSPEKILNHPRLLIEIFAESAAQRAPLNSEAKRLVQDFAHLIDDDFRRDPK
jgi:[protein-PII] uridylyltransferase